jgi:serine/threonine protein kinase
MTGGGSRVGTIFGPYELQSLLGVGGMGEVYRAYDTAKDHRLGDRLAVRRDDRQAVGSYLIPGAPA